MNSILSTWRRPAGRALARPATFLDRVAAAMSNRPLPSASATTPADPRRAPHSDRRAGDESEYSAPLMVIPAWRSELQDASTTDDQELPTHHVHQDGSDFAWAPFDNRYLLTVTLAPASIDADLLRIHAVGQPTTADLLLVLHSGPDNRRIGRIITTIAGYDELTLTAILATELHAGFREQIIAAIGASLTSERNAWRRIARNLVADDPVRRAIVDGLELT
ncbi:hypothetical protein [Nocardia brasiliensis]|uniref:hypothetical protein n=2 Tax=Nocardia brasiliensis TaxID=37326 RepID=UPI001893A87E|nr:hypothetical protein [Nocardia brasiliensis]MBF6129667.1 hypothetical protein [Nocardia brasiliensis]